MELSKERPENEKGGGCMEILGMAVEVMGFLGLGLGGLDSWGWVWGSRGLWGLKGAGVGKVEEKGRLDGWHVEGDPGLGLRGRDKEMLEVATGCGELGGELCGGWDADVWFVEGMRSGCWCGARMRVD